VRALRETLRQHGLRALNTIARMDSLTQITLGAATALAVLAAPGASRQAKAALAGAHPVGRAARPPAPVRQACLSGRQRWQAAAWGAFCGTLPDLDVFIDHGDALLNMTLHRGHSHGLFWLALLSLPLALVAARLHTWASWQRWWGALALALLTHPLLDALTIYGTQLLQPFSDEAFGVGSVFIIDPGVTLPWLVGLTLALWLSTRRGWHALVLGLGVGTAYLAWGVAAQQSVAQRALAALAAQGIQPQAVLVTPTPLNTLLWRIVAVDEEHVVEGFYSFRDDEQPLKLDRFERGMGLLAGLRDDGAVRRLARFTDGLYRLRDAEGRLAIADLRMGQEPGYVFEFAIAKRHADGWMPVRPENIGARRMDTAAGLAWLWRRAAGQRVDPPR
jgi:inner membrane protein